MAQISEGKPLDAAAPSVESGMDRRGEPGGEATLRMSEADAGAARVHS